MQVTITHGKDGNGKDFTPDFDQFEQPELTTFHFGIRRFGELVTRETMKADAEGLSFLWDKMDMPCVSFETNFFDYAQDVDMKFYEKILHNDRNVVSLQIGSFCCPDLEDLKKMERAVKTNSTIQFLSIAVDGSRFDVLDAIFDMFSGHSSLKYIDVQTRASHIAHLKYAALLIEKSDCLQSFVWGTNSEQSLKHFIWNYKMAMETQGTHSLYFTDKETDRSFVGSLATHTTRVKSPEGIEGPIQIDVAASIKLHRENHGKGTDTNETTSDSYYVDDLNAIIASDVLSRLKKATQSTTSIRNIELYGIDSIFLTYDNLQTAMYEIHNDCRKNKNHRGRQRKLKELTDRQLYEQISTSPEMIKFMMDNLSMSNDTENNGTKRKLTTVHCNNKKRKKN